MSLLRKIKTILCLFISIFFIAKCGNSDEQSEAITEDKTLALTDVFSLDFVHPKLAGQIIMANLVIDKINTLYIAQVPHIKFKFKDDDTHVSTISEDMLTPTKVDGLDTIVVLGDSLTSGYEKQSTATHFFTENNFGILVAKQVGLDVGTEDGNSFRYPNTDNETNPAYITNQANSKPFHLLGLPSARVKDLTVKNFTTEAANDPYIANLLTSSVLLWQQVLRHLGSGSGKSAIDQMSEILSTSTNEPLVIINTGNNDLLAPTVYELQPTTLATTFDTLYSQIIAATPEESNPNFILFNVANVGAAPALKANLVAANMGTMGGAFQSILDAFPTLYGNTNKHLSPLDYYTNPASPTPYPVSIIEIDKATDWIKLTAIDDIDCLKADPSSEEKIGTTEDNPLPDKCWLDTSEQNEIDAAYVTYTDIIQAYANDNANIEFVDTQNALVKVVNKGSISVDDLN